MTVSSTTHSATERRRHDRRGGEQPHRLLEHPGQPGQGGVVLGGEPAAVAQQRVYFRADPLLRGRVLAEQVQREGERGGGGFMAGQQKDQHLLAELGGVELLAVLTAGRGQQPEQVAAGSPPRRAMISSQTAYSACLRRPRPAVAGGGPPPRYAHRGQPARAQDVVAQDREVGPYRADRGLDVGRRTEIRATIRRVNRDISAAASTTRRAPPTSARPARRPRRRSRRRSRPPGGG